MFFRHEDHFPISSADHTTPNIIMAVQHHNRREPSWADEDFKGRSILAQYAMCLGQARLLYGPDVKDLPKPISVTMVSCTPLKYHLSAFQLNTLDLSGPKKNIWWEEEEVMDIAETAAYVRALPTLDGYNPDVFRKMAAMYLQGVQ